MVDLAILRAAGVTQENLERKLGGDPLGKDPSKGFSFVNPDDVSEKDKIVALCNRIRSRVQEGRTRNLRDFRSYYALDQAWEKPFQQITPTILQTFIDSDPNNDDVYKAFQSWGLTSMLTTEKDPKSGKDVRKLNLPMFFNIFVPLVKSYVTIRWAKIMNDRRLTPFFKYEPVKNTSDLTVRCETITDRIQVMSNQYGYFDVQKQAVLKMLHYGQCFQFIKEEWHCEEQYRYADDTDVASGKTKPKAGSDEREPVVVGDTIKVTDKEGLRYHLPHPTRTYYDLAHGPYTLNYDSGCEYTGYWRIARYRDIYNSGFWNKDKIALGSGDLIAENSLFFSTVYSACQVSFLPKMSVPTSAEGGAAVAGVGAPTMDREKEVAWQYYGTDFMDQGVLVTEHFEKLVPKDNGLGNYDCPVWFRFVVAGDGCTILYACPLVCAPCIYYGYDADESRTKNASMSLEILPFQDHFSNALTQIILTAKQNLANLTLIDGDMVDTGMIQKLKNMGESAFRTLNIFEYSSKKAGRAQTQVRDVGQSIGLPKGNVSELTGVLKTILDVLERVLVMSSQEVGQAASHEQTREEIKNIASSASTRLVFTATPVDIAASAWKRQLYFSLMAYGDDDIYVRLPSDIPLTQDMLIKMGFTFLDKDAQKEGSTGFAGAKTKERYMSARINKKRTAIPIWELAGNRDGEDRTDNEKIAVTLATILDKLLSNPITAQAIGADQAIDYTNEISKLAGLPRDLKFKNVMANTADPAAQQAAAQDDLKMTIQAVMGAVNKNLTQELTPLLDEMRKNSKDIALLMPNVANILNTLNIPPAPQTDDPNTAPAAPAPASQGNP